MTSQAGLSGHVAWRASYAIVPVPALVSVAMLTLFFGTDHPAGKWSDRHRPLIEAGLESLSITDREKKAGDDQEKGDMDVTVTVEPTLETGGLHIYLSILCALVFTCVPIRSDL